MISETQRILDLIESYKKVGDVILQRTDLDFLELEASRSFFTAESLKNRSPIPRDVDVYAILAGISFDNESITFIQEQMCRLKEVLGDELYYFVKPENLGVEYAVIKWPDDKKVEDNIQNSIKFLERWEGRSFLLNIVGIQLHVDGCIILKGVDERGEISNFRQNLISKFSELPKKQSNWAHVPIGRILAPIGEQKMRHLKQVIAEIDHEMDFQVPIKEIHLVNETRWYMEEKEYLLTKYLS